MSVFMCVDCICLQMYWINIHGDKYEEVIDGGALKNLA